MRARAILLAVLVTTLAVSARGAELRLSTEPPDLDAWAGEQYLGRTPLSAKLPDGPMVLRVSEPSESLYAAPVVDTLLSLRSQDKIDLHFRIGRKVLIQSQPYGLPLLRNGVRIGETPLWVRIDPDRLAKLSILTSEGLVPISTRTLLSDGHWSWYGDAQDPKGFLRPSRSRWQTLGRFLMPAVAGAFFGAGLWMEEQADQAYDRYLAAVEPSEIEEQYDRARTRDAWAAALWIGAEVSLVASVLSWILPEKPPLPAEGLQP